MPSAPDAVSRDDHLITTLPGGRLRVAVLDGVTSGPDTPELAGIDGGAAAAACLRAVLRAEDDVLRAAESAGRFLRRPALIPRSQPQTCAVICDLPPRADTGQPSIVRFGDCEAWVRVLDRWRPVLAGSCLTPDAAGRLREWKRAHPDATLEEAIVAESLLTRDAAAYVTAPVGCLPDVRPEWGALPAFDELVLASDGALLTPERLSDIEEWLMARPHEDDVTVLRVRPA
jgi:hypothetical protein